MTNPYTHAPVGAFWKKAVSAGVDLRAVAGSEVLIRQGERVASAGSCFASNIVPFIEQAGFEYVRVDGVGRCFGRLAEDNFGYANFSARYGNIYTVRQAVQLVKRALGQFRPVEDRWVLDRRTIVDPFRPGLRYPASSTGEFDVLTAQHLRNVVEVFRRADVFVFTLGLTEAWESKLDGAVFPACPGTIAGTFDPARHGFHNFSITEVGADLDELIGLTRTINPGLRFILTVSPVPLVATASHRHVLVASVYSKSVLRVAADEASRRHGHVVYFPAYEIVTGPHAPHDFFEADRREPSPRAIRHVMHAFLAHCETPYEIDVDDVTESRHPDLRPAASPAGDQAEDHVTQLSRIIANAECEEEAAGLGADVNG